MVVESQYKIQYMSMGRSTITNTYQFLLNLKSFSHSRYHILDQRTLQSVQRLVALLLGRSFYTQFAVCQANGDVPVQLLAELAYRSFNLDGLIFTSIYRHSAGDLAGMFSFSCPITFLPALLYKT